MEKEVTAFYSCTVHSHSCFREFALNLQRLVTGERRTVIDKNLLETFALPLVASRQHCDVLVVPFFAGKQSPENHFRMRSLAGSSGCDIAHTYCRNLAGMHLEHATVI